ncbi:MAG TPA: hypothetical protein VND65_18065 [Candidatus Binatia bacterium]|nr:hypothetical protein [Candidatus Binatia bacterium]
MPIPKYDIPGIVHDFGLRKFEERTELFKMATASMDANEIKLLVAEVGQHAVENNSTPVQVIGLGFAYGVVIGILAEKYRRRIQ